MLDMAKRWLGDTLAVLGPAIEAGVPVVGLEPSCVAVFRDEMRELLPDREDAKRLAGQTFLLSEFLEQQHFQYPKLYRRALVHGHCHHKAVMKFDAERRALEAMGLTLDVLDSGCCGMAGSFGFEREHYDVSIKVGEEVLLPALRRASRDTLIIADGFSCREQIAQATDRRALHLADVIAMAGRDGVQGPAGDYPESHYVPDYGTDRRLRPSTITVMGLLAAAAVALVVWQSRRRRLSTAA
jgi:Fe-S oxidoreductase